MSTKITNNGRAPQLLSAPVRIASALAVAAIVACAWLAAGHASREAVLASAEAISPRIAFVRLQPVEVIGHRVNAGTARVAAAQECPSQPANASL